MARSFEALLIVLGLASCRQTDTATGARVAIPVASAAPASVSAPPQSSGAREEAPAADDTAVAERLKMAGLEPEAVEGFLSDLKTRVARGDREGVCALVSYPLKARKRVPNAAECRAGYDKIFTTRVTDAIGKQQFADLFVNSQGVMIGDGEVWVAGICDDPRCKRVELRIGTINN